MPEQPWEFRDFVECLDRWVIESQPDDDLRLVVTQWVMARHDNPYEGVRRVQNQPGLWVARIRETYRPAADGAGLGTMVTCSYWVLDEERVIHCERIQTLNLPI